MRFWWVPAVLLPSMSWAQLAGTWVVQPESTTFQKYTPTTLSLDRGVYRRTDCRGDPIDMPADGAFHEVKKQPFFNSMAVRVLNDHRVAIEQKLADKTTWKGAYVVSKSGAEMTLEFENDLAAKPVTGALRYVREGAAVGGAHPITGTWRLDKLIRLSPSGSSLTFTLEQSSSDQHTDDRFTFLASDGRSAEGKTDVKYYPLQGYLAGATLSVDRLQPEVWKINRNQNGALVELSSAKVSDDGHTMMLRKTDWLCQEMTIFTLRKQTPP
jgi:hypothetical protein